MGQYHKIVNIDKKQILTPHEFTNGFKLLEFNSGFIMQAFAVLLAVSNGRGGGDFNNELESSLVGSWAGDRIAIIGDYWEEDEALETGIPTWEMIDNEDNDGNPKETDYEDISREILTVMCNGDTWFREEFLESLAHYDYGRDWSDLFSESELQEARDKVNKERENGL